MEDEKLPNCGVSVAQTEKGYGVQNVLVCKRSQGAASDGGRI